MEYNWNSIKETIKLNCEHVFSESSLSYTLDDLEEALIIFNNFLLYPMPGCDSIRGLENNFVEALQQACLNAEGIQSYLDTITTDFEPFMKKLLILTGALHYANLTARTWMFERLFQQLTIAPTFYSEGKTLAAIESTIEDYKTNQEGIYIIAKARLCRNEIHNAKYLDLQQIGATLKYALGMYVWLILKTKNSLISHIPELSREQMEISPTDLDNQYLYDFLSFGQTANEVKNKFVDSYILNRIYNHEPKIVVELIDEVKAFSKGSLNADSIKRFLEKLKDKRKIHYSNPGCTEVQLSSSEHERIKNSASLYANSISTLKNQIKSEIDVISTTYNLDNLISAFSSFLDDNFSKDIEVFEGDGSSQLYSNYQFLIGQIEREGFSHAEALSVYKILVNHSKSNKILYKLSLGRVVSRLSNNSTFDNYSRQYSREVYLDTQIVLYMLCLHEDLPRPKQGALSIAQHIVDVGRKHKSIVFKFPKVYIYEVINHFRRALNLILLTDNPGVDGMAISNNVFYQCYCCLKNDMVLPEGIDSFREYMSKIYHLEPEDLNKDFKGIVKNLITDILSGEQSVSIIKDIPFYNEEELEPIKEIFRDVIKDNDFEQKDEFRLKSDSIIGKYLFEGQFANEPFFLTYDRSFKEYKKKYIELYKRRNPSYFWHLLTPSQFLNHIDLLNLKIDEGRLTNELLSLIESDDFEFKTHSLIDDICRFIDVPGITPELKEKSLKTLMKRMVGNGEFNSQIESINSGENTIIKKFCEVSNDVFSYYLEQGGNELSQYASLFAENDKRQSLFDILMDCSSNTERFNRDKVIYEIETLF